MADTAPEKCGVEHSPEGGGEWEPFVPADALQQMFDVMKTSEDTPFSGGFHGPSALTVLSENERMRWFVDSLTRHFCHSTTDLISGVLAQATDPDASPELTTTRAMLISLRDSMATFAPRNYPSLFSPIWLTENVVALRDAILADRAFDRLPILADALEEAGCDTRVVLDHLRAGDDHAHMCWVLDVLSVGGGVGVHASV